MLRIEKDGTHFVVQSQHGSHSLPIARIYVDALEQIKSVALLRGFITPHECRRVLQLAASHLCHYYVAREGVEPIKTTLPRITPTRLNVIESHRLLDFGCIPDTIGRMRSSELRQALGSVGIEIIETDHHTIQAALAAIVNHPRFTRRGILLSISPGNRVPWPDLHMIEVTVPQPERFRFWREVPGRPLPREIRELRRTFLIDTVTDVVLHQSRPSVLIVHPPHTTLQETHFGDDVSAACVEGRRLEIEVDPARILGDEGIEYAVSLLTCALGKDNRYISYLST